MAESKTPDKIPVTINLPADLARRLKSAADTQQRPASDVVVDLLDRHLPRTSPGGPKKGSIPYA